MDVIWHGFEHVLQELPGCLSVSFFDQLGHSKLAGSVDAHEEIELAFGGLYLGDVDVKKADRILFEFRPLRLVALDAMPL